MPRQRTKWLDATNIVCDNLFVEKKSEGLKIVDDIEYFDEKKHNLAIIDENNEIKRTFKMGTLVDAIYTNFSPVSGFEIRDNEMKLKDKFKYGKIDITEFTALPSHMDLVNPIENDLLNFFDNSQWLICSDLPLHLHKAITFLFYFKPIDKNIAESLFNYGNNIDFYKENDNVYVRLNNDAGNIVSIAEGLLENEVNIIGVSFDINNNKIYCYKSKLEKDILPFPIIVKKLDYPYPTTALNNQIEVGHSQFSNLLNHSYLGSFYCSLTLHTDSLEFERLEKGVNISRGIVDFDEIEEDADLEDKVLGFTPQKNVVQMDITLADLQNIYSSFNILKGYAILNGVFKLNSIWKDGVVDYPNGQINIIDDTQLDFTNNTDKYIQITGLPLTNYNLLTFAFRIKPLNDTDKEAVLCYGSNDNRVEFYKENEYCICSLYRNGVNYDININQSGMDKIPLFWYNFGYDLGASNIGNNAADLFITDRIGGNVDSDARELALSNNSTCSFARGIRQINETAPKKLTWSVWFKRDAGSGSNFNLDISLRSTFNWKRFMVDSNFGKIWLKNDNLSGNYSFNTDVPVIATNSVPTIWVFVAVSYNGDDGTLNFVMKDETLATFNYEKTQTLSGGQQSTFNDRFFTSDAGVLEFELSKGSVHFRVEDPRIFNDYLTIQELNDIYDNQRVVSLGAISPLKLDQDNILGISFDTANNKVYHYIDGNMFNTTHPDIGNKLPDFSLINDELHIGRLVSDNAVVNTSYVGGFATFYDLLKTPEQYQVMADGYVKISKLLDLNNITQSSDTNLNILCIDSANNIFRSDKKISDLP